MSGFTLWDGQLVEASNYTITAGETVRLLESAEISNSSSPDNSLRVVIDYDDLTPGFGSGRIGAVIEAEDDAGHWNPIHYQFSPMASANSQATNRILILQPDMDTYNQGIDDIVYPVDEEVSRISRGQGVLPATKFRVVILLTDSDPQGVNAFQSVKISAAGEAYSV